MASASVRTRLITGCRTFDEAEIKRVYYPEIIELIKAESGAKRVVVFDHTLRTADDASAKKQKIREAGPPRAQRLHRVVRPAARAATSCRTRPTNCSRRFAIIQVWRPIRHPVETHPLAIADARTMSPKDFVISERRYPNRIGQTYAIAYNPKHRWYWFPRQARDEALVFTVYESLKDGRARLDPPIRLSDRPDHARQARPRESIESHAGVF